MVKGLFDSAHYDEINPNDYEIVHSIDIIYDESNGAHSLWGSEGIYADDIF
jgi:hypothetical protein